MLRRAWILHVACTLSHHHCNPPLRHHMNETRVNDDARVAAVTIAEIGEAHESTFQPSTWFG